MEYPLGKVSTRLKSSSRWAESSITIACRNLLQKRPDLMLIVRVYFQSMNQTANERRGSCREKGKMMRWNVTNLLSENAGERLAVQ